MSRVGEEPKDIWDFPEDCRLVTVTGRFFYGRLQPPVGGRFRRDSFAARLWGGAALWGTWFGRFQAVFWDSAFVARSQRLWRASERGRASPPAPAQLAPETAPPIAPSLQPSTPTPQASPQNALTYWSDTA